MRAVNFNTEQHPSSISHSFYNRIVFKHSSDIGLQSGSNPTGRNTLVTLCRARGTRGGRNATPPRYLKAETSVKQMGPVNGA